MLSVQIWHPKNNVQAMAPFEQWFLKETRRHTEHHHDEHHDWACRVARRQRKRSQNEQQNDQRILTDFHQPYQHRLTFFFGNFIRAKFREPALGFLLGRAADFRMQLLHNIGSTASRYIDKLPGRLQP